jgi:hypothetical protein
VKSAVRELIQQAMRLGTQSSAAIRAALYQTEIEICIWAKNFWLQIRKPGFDSRHYQKKSSGSGTGSTQPREYN